MKKQLIIFSAVFLLLTLVRAEFYMPSIFGDSMVLQMDKPIKFWGVGDANAKVCVEFNDEKSETYADHTGKWTVMLKKQTMSKEPRSVKIYQNGKLEKEFIDVLVGEVWILGGQSNMDWRIITTSDYPNLLKRKENYKHLRYYTGSNAASKVLESKSTRDAKWQRIDTSNIEKWASTGVYFGEALMLSLDVPVGLVRSCQSGTSMFLWIPEEAQRKAEFLRDTLVEYEKNVANYSQAEEQKKWEAGKKAWDEKADKLRAEGKPVPDLPNIFTYQPSADPCVKHGYPGWLFNGRTFFLAGYTARGVAWYQGEAETSEKRLVNFRNNFKLLMSEWRKAWNDDLPFLFVQLASFGSGGKNWPIIRWEQYLTTLDVNNAFMVPIPDMGDSAEIHFPKKKELAERMRDVALQKVYGKNVYSKCPVFKSAIYDKSRVIITVEDFGRNLLASKDSLSGLEVEIEKDKWVKGAAVLENGKIVLRSPQDENIIGIRYLWKDDCMSDVCLINKDGLPLIPFIDRNKK